MASLPQTKTISVVSFRLEGSHIGQGHEPIFLIITFSCLLFLYCLISLTWEYSLNKSCIPNPCLNLCFKKNKVKTTFSVISLHTAHAYDYLIVKILKHSPVALLFLNIIERILASEISQSKSISLVVQPLWASIAPLKIMLRMPQWI